ncbi:MAG: flagellar biosynthetic protein FliO [Fibromonadales bacterium]|nr:flagellar biosynthetic protein FliO [Fibromonadales bacterium]
MDKAVIILILLIGSIAAQTSEDTLSAAARNDSAIAAFKFEAMKQALGESYQPQPAATESYKPPDLGNIAIRMTIGLGVILILLYVLFVLAKKVRKIESPASNDKQSVIQLLDSKFLGAGKTIFLIKAGAERILVVGSSQEGMRTLSEIQGNEARYIMETYDSKPVTAAQFSATVDHLLRRFRREGGG